MGGLMKIQFDKGASALVLAGSLLFGGATVQAAEETLQGMLAAQIRSQGYVCSQPLRAKQDRRRSKPDHGVWVLDCGNANFRVSRVPDMAAKVEPLP
jgi:hypothetical protein